MNQFMFIKISKLIIAGIIFVLTVLMFKKEIKEWWKKNKGLEFEDEL